MANKIKNNSKKELYRYLGLYTLLSIVIVIHLALGIAGIAGGENAMRAITIFYGANVEINAQFNYVLKILGAYMLTFAILGFLALRNPIKNKVAIDALIILLIFRALERLFLFESTSTAFNISPNRMILGIIAYLLVAVFLFILTPGRFKR